MPLLQVINEKMNSYVSKFAESNEMFETKDLAGKFSVDGLASCAFGVETGSFEDGTSEFLRLDSGQLISLLNSNFPINMSESEVRLVPGSRC